MAGLVVCSGFFSGAETAFFSLRREDIDDLAHRHPHTGALIRAILARPEKLLASILFGNLVVNILYFSLGAEVTIAAAGRLGYAAAAVPGAAVLVVLLAFGEILPKALAAASPRAVARATAAPFWVFHRAAGRPVGMLASPVLAAIERLGPSRSGPELTADELCMLVDLAERSGALSGAEADLIDGVVELSDLTVREVMVPRVDVVFASIADRPEQVLRKLCVDVLSRAPVYDGRLDNIVGVVEAKDLLAALGHGEARPPDLRPFTRPVAFIPESAKLAAVLEKVRDEGFEAAVVVDEYGGTSGFLTFQDVAEAIFGRIDERDEAENGPAVERTGPDSYVLSGDLLVREWSDLFGVQAERGEFDTLGGLVGHLLGRVPKTGDAATWGNLRFEVRQMRGRRVWRVGLLLESEGAAFAGPASLGGKEAAS